MAKTVYIKPVSTIKANLGINPGGKVQAFFTDACARYMEPYIPQRNGDLRKNKDIQPTFITYESPYASYQYYGKRKDGTRVINPENYTTEGTGPYWDKQMLSVEKDSLLKEVKEYIKYHGG